MFLPPSCVHWFLFFSLLYFVPSHMMPIPGGLSTPKIVNILFDINWLQLDLVSTVLMLRKPAHSLNRLKRYDSLLLAVRLISYHLNLMDCSTNCWACVWISCWNRHHIFWAWIWTIDGFIWHVLCGVYTSVSLSYINKIVHNQIRTQQYSPIIINYPLTCALYGFFFIISANFIVFSYIGSVWIHFYEH